MTHSGTSFLHTSRGRPTIPWSDHLSNNAMWIFRAVRQISGFSKIIWKCKKLHWTYETNIQLKGNRTFTWTLQRSERLTAIFHLLSVQASEVNLHIYIYTYTWYMIYDIWYIYIYIYTSMHLCIYMSIFIYLHIHSLSVQESKVNLRDAPLPRRIKCSLRAPVHANIQTHFSSCFCLTCQEANLKQFLKTYPDASFQHFFLNMFRGKITSYL